MKATITEPPITLHLHIAEVQLKDLDIIGELRFKSHTDILYSSCIMTEATDEFNFYFHSWQRSPLLWKTKSYIRGT